MAGLLGGSGPVSGRPEERRALAEVLGALAYALLRVFGLSASASAVAPTVGLAERQASFALGELQRFRVLRRYLDEVAADAEEALGAFRAPLDAFFDAAPARDWLSVQVFQFLGDAIATDFAQLLSARVDPAAAAVVREALGGRAEHESFALAQSLEIMTSDPTARGRAIAVAGAIVGGALSGLRQAVLASDALAVVLGGEDEVKGLVMELLANHRERLERLGIEEVG